MLLEWGGFGATVELAAVPAPAGMPLAAWCNCFPCFGFLLTCVPARTDECVRRFTDRGLAAARVGSIDGSGRIVLEAGGEARTVLDLRETPVTGLQARVGTAGY